MSRRSQYFFTLAMVFALWAPGASVRADDKFWPDGQPRTNGQDAIVQELSPTYGSVHTGTDLEIVELATGATRTLTATEAWEGPPDIAGDWVVWREEPQSVDQYACASRIMAADLSTGTTVALAEGLRAPTAPRISGDLVVWGAYTGRCSPDGSASSLGDFVLTVFSLGRMERVEVLGPFSGFVSTPEIDGDRVIWSQHPESPGGFPGNLMYLPSGATGLPVKLDTVPYDRFDISGAIVAYVDRQERLIILDLAGFEATVIDAGPVDYVTIENDVLAWSERVDSDTWKLHGYSLEDDERYELDSSSAPIQPHLGGGTLVWQADFGQAVFGVRSAPVGDFERLHALSNRKEGLELLRWGGIAGVTALLLAVAWRRLGAGQRTASRANA